MPQTKEHFEILQALGIDDGIIAITKKDMVDEEWLEMLVEDVKDYFKGSFLRETHDSCFIQDRRKHRMF